MAKALIGRDRDSQLYTINYIIDNFDTPAPIDVQKINEIKKVDTIYFNHGLYTFIENGHRYYYFEDEIETLTPQKVKDDLDHVALIKTPITGRLCTPKGFNPMNEIYGFTDDPDQDSFIYLWCGSVES